MLRANATIQELSQLLATNQITPEEVIAFYKKRFTTLNPLLNCGLELFEEESAHSTLPATSTHPLWGIPGLIKDNICQYNKTTSAGSAILKNFKAPYDATVIKRLKGAGAPILGRANMDEFAMGSSGEFSAYGQTKNPWDTSRSPGGSSSGSAAAVAAGIVPWALGTETGGSVRQPASFCGLTGLYPTYGLISRFGVLAFCSSTDQVGPLTKTVYDNAYLLSILAGKDEQDSTSINQSSFDYTQGLLPTLPKGIRIGVLREALEGEGLDPQVQHAFQESIKDLEKMGAKIEYITLPKLKYGIAIYFILSRAEAASNLSRYDGSLYGMRHNADSLFEMYLNTREEGFGDEVKRRILLGNYVLSSGHKDAYYVQANHVRSILRREFNDVFRSVDLIMSPTSSTLPFKLGEASKDPLTMYLSDCFTVPNCITGLPALSLTGGFSQEGLPIGVQFMGPRLSEHLLYKVAYAFEQAHDYYTRMPSGFAD